MPEWKFCVEIRNQRLKIPLHTKFQPHWTKIENGQIFDRPMPKFGHFGLIWSYAAEIWHAWVFLGADYEYELRISIHAQLDTKISLLSRFYVIFGHFWERSLS